MSKTDLINVVGLYCDKCLKFIRWGSWGELKKPSLHCDLGSLIDKEQVAKIIKEKGRRIK